MEKINVLCSVLRLYESNFRLLHWNAVGSDFNDSHVSITTNYYEEISDTIDKIAEIGCMLNIMPLNYQETLEVIDSSEYKFLSIDSKKLYTRKEIVSMSDIMLGDICKLLIEVIQDEKIQLPENIGIKSDLEGILAKYITEHRFINKRRLISFEQ